MRPLPLALALLFAVPFAVADEKEEYAKLLDDAARAKPLKDGFNILKNYFKFAAEAEKGKTKSIAKRDQKLDEFLKWLDETETTLGIDLRTKPGLVCEMLDDARVKELANSKRGQIDYVKVENAAGMDRFEYAVLLPKSYTPKSRERHRYPLVVTMHERVINPKHPAFRSTKDPAERGRVAIYNNWYKTPAAEKVVVIAPTGGPNGFMFNKDPFGDLQVLYRSMGNGGLVSFRTDWDRVFLELAGPAFRVALEQSLMFAGIILRDREGYNKLPIPEEEFFALENLNGVPLIYVADDATWDKVGKPLSEALTAAYQKMGQPQNFILMRDKRDGNGALKGDQKKIAEFLQEHKRPMTRESFTWRYYRPSMSAPVPLVIGQANYDYDPDVALEKTAGSIKFKVSREKYKVKKKDKNGKEVTEEGTQNVVDVQITEAEILTILFFDGMVNLSMPVTVKINGKVIHERVKLKRDWGKFARDVLPLRFFMIPFVAELRCEFEHKPQFVKPKKKDAGGENPGQNGDKDGGAAKAADSKTDK